MESLGDALDLVKSQDGSHVQDDSRVGETLDQRSHEVARPICNRNLYIDIASPASDSKGLRLHAFDVVSEDFQRDRAVGDGAKQLTAEGLVIDDAGLTHQSRIGGKSSYPGIGVERHDAAKVGSVAEEFDAKAFDSRQGLQRRSRL